MHRQPRNGQAQAFTISGRPRPPASRRPARRPENFGTKNAGARRNGVDTHEFSLNVCATYADGRSAFVDRWGRVSPPCRLRLAGPVRQLVGHPSIGRYGVGANRQPHTDPVAGGMGVGTRDMYLLYLDDSGSVGASSDEYIVLAGLAVFERQVYWRSKDLDDLAARISPDNPDSMEFRGSDIRTGKKRWRKFRRQEREQMYMDALGIVAMSNLVTVFAAAIHKASVLPEDPMEYAFEQMANRFDRYSGRLHDSGNTQRGLIVLDKSSAERALQGLTHKFRRTGHRWGRLHNMADVPFFVDSKATRTIQFADLIAHATRRYYENGDAALFDVFSRRFDATGGAVHGLVHYAPTGSRCDCPACRPQGRTPFP